jgi:hypothetical protein
MNWCSAPPGQSLPELYVYAIKVQAQLAAHQTNELKHLAQA